MTSVNSVVLISDSALIFLSSASAVGCLPIQSRLLTINYKVFDNDLVCKGAPCKETMDSSPLLFALTNNRRWDFSWVCLVLQMHPFALWEFR